MNKMAKQFDIDISKIDVRSTIIMHKINNEKYQSSDATTPRRPGKKASISPRYLTMSAKAVQSERNVEI